MKPWLLVLLALPLLGCSGSGTPDATSKGPRPQNGEAAIENKELFLHFSDPPESLTADPSPDDTSMPARCFRALSVQVGRETVVVGIAGDAKGGAVLLLDGESVFISGLSRWSDGLRGKTVCASGVLDRRWYIPQMVVKDGEVICVGAYRKQFVLEGAEWKVLGK